jgi:hypothetical protein
MVAERLFSLLLTLPTHESHTACILFLLCVALFFYGTLLSFLKRWCKKSLESMCAGDGQSTPRGTHFVDHPRVTKEETGALGKARVVPGGNEKSSLFSQNNICFLIERIFIIENKERH